MTCVCVRERETLMEGLQNGRAQRRSQCLMLKVLQRMFSTTEKPTAASEFLT